MENETVYHVIEKSKTSPYISKMKEKKWSSDITESPVFVISTGRSGSTLVQRVLNCHLDLVLWGEHHGFLLGLSRSHEKMNNTNLIKFPKTPDENKGPQQLLPTLNDPSAPLEWANPCSLVEFESKVRTFIVDYFRSRLTKGHRWGFKEILYNNLATLNMLRVLFPQGKFIFVRRDPIEVTRSKVLAFIKESNWYLIEKNERHEKVKKMLKEVRDHYRVYDLFLKRYPKAAIAIDYESLVTTPHEVITIMLGHLDLDPTNYNWALAKDVMKRVISRTERDASLLEFIHEVAATSF